MRRRTIVCLALLALWTVACGGGESQAPPPASSPSAPEPPLVPAPAPRQPDAPSAGAHPTPEFDLASGDAAAGEGLYQQYCASCHGPLGRGDGPVGAALNPKPADHSNGDYMNALSDEHLFKVVKYGGTAVDRSPLMAPWGGTLSDEQIVDVVAFVRSLADSGP